MARWNPRQTYTKHEEWIMRRLGRTRKLFAFLRAQRHALFDDAFQAELGGPSATPHAGCLTGAHVVVLHPVRNRPDEVLGARQLRDRQHRDTRRSTVTRQTGPACPEGWQVPAVEGTGLFGKVFMAIRP